jgi:hypothetical protein
MSYISKTIGLWSRSFLKAFFDLAKRMDHREKKRQRKERKKCIRKRKMTRECRK